MNVLVIGLGNPILGDDGVGWKVAREVTRRTAGQPGIEVDMLSLGGLSLMERLSGSERVILIDSLSTDSKEKGRVQVFKLADLPDHSQGHTTAAHDTSLQNALRVGKSLDLPLPALENIQVVTVETETGFDFSETLSPPVEAAVPFAVEEVLRLIAQMKGD